MGTYNTHKEANTGGVGCETCYDHSEEGPGGPETFSCRRWCLNWTFKNAESLHEWEGVGEAFHSVGKAKVCSGDGHTTVWSRRQ